MKRSSTKSLGYKRNRSLVGELQRQRQELEFEPGNVTKAGQPFLIVSMFSHGAIEAETDRGFVGRQIAHDAKATDSATRIPAQIDEQTARVMENPIERRWNF